MIITFNFSPERLNVYDWIKANSKIRWHYRVQTSRLFSYVWQQFIFITIINTSIFTVIPFKFSINPENTLQLLLKHILIYNQVPEKTNLRKIFLMLIKLCLSSKIKCLNLFNIHWYVKTNTCKINILVCYQYKFCS